jgi:2-methylisocitrate lyase-like PEP mutase family enzyme
VQPGIDIRTVCPLPFILDGACGWGDPMHLHRTVRVAEAAARRPGIDVLMVQFENDP